MQLPFNSDTAKLFSLDWAEGYGQPHLASVTQYMSTKGETIENIEFLENVGCDCYHMTGWFGPVEQITEFASAVTKGLNGYLDKMDASGIELGDAVIVAVWYNESHKLAYGMIVSYVGQGELDDSYEEIALPFKNKSWPDILACTSSGDDWNMVAQIKALKNTFNEQDPLYQDAQRAVLLSASTESLAQILQSKNTRHAWSVV